MAAEERVLCFQRKLFEELGVFQGLSLDVEKYLPIVTAPSNLEYLNRSAAEQDRRYKQLIPYVVVRQDRRIFLMERSSAGGDARLHGKASIGVGGHLNPVDRGQDPLMGGLQREWSEELIAEFEPDFRLVGFLNDDTNPVGAVHLGVVFTVEADGHAVAVREHEKLTGRFATPDEILAAWDRLETWSQLTLAALNLQAATLIGSS